MPGKVIRLCDYERRSREPDTVSPRDPADADAVVIEFPRAYVSPLIREGAAWLDEYQRSMRPCQ